MFSRMERRTLWRVLPRESLFVLGVIISAIALCQFRGVKVSFNVARMAPMGWSVGSAVTVAMLTGATQQVDTAAAILAGQVSVTEKLKIFILDWNLHQKMRDFRKERLWKHNYHPATLRFVSFIWQPVIFSIFAHFLVMQTVTLYWCYLKKTDFQQDSFLYFFVPQSLVEPLRFTQTSVWSLYLVVLSICLQQRGGEVWMSEQGWGSLL